MAKGGIRRWQRSQIVAVTALAAATLLPTSARGASTPPTYAHEFPDPSAVEGDGAYFAYGTNVFPFGVTINVPTVTSTDLANWSYVTDALPDLGSWASEGFTWAPSVSRVGSQWVLYYTATHTSSGRECIGRATAASPQGPFRDTFGSPLVCQLDRGGSIDASSFVAGGGQRFLLWKSEDDTLGGEAVLWSAPLSADGTTLAGAATALLHASSVWQDGTIEGPAMAEFSGVTFLFYGGNHFSSAAYAIGYATCSSPSGPCVDQSRAQPWVSSNSTDVIGPGGPSVLTTSTGGRFLLFHGWINGVGYGGGERAMYVQPLTFSARAPSIPALHYQPNRLLRSSNTSGVADVALTFGDPGDKQLACDTTGKGVDTPVVVRNGVWYSRDTNTSGAADHAFAFGDPGDVPVCGDWNNDGTDTPGVFRRGTWYLRNSNSTGRGEISFGYGNPGDEPIVGRWSGLGVSIGVHRDSTFFLATQLGAPIADVVLTYGNRGDRAIAGDWNNDGIDTIGIMRAGVWYLRNSNSSGVGDIVVSYGDAADVPLPGDWTGQGTDTLGVAR
jgi:hypothetical protein